MGCCGRGGGAGSEGCGGEEEGGEGRVGETETGDFGGAAGEVRLHAWKGNVSYINAHGFVLFLGD